MSRRTRLSLFKKRVIISGHHGYCTVVVAQAFLKKGLPLKQLSYTLTGEKGERERGREEKTRQGDPSERERYSK